MALGLGLLRLPPEAFWALSLPELSAAISGLRGDLDAAAPLGSSELAALMTIFPDTTRQDAHD